MFTAVGRHLCHQIDSFCLHSAIFCLDPVQLLSLPSWRRAFGGSLIASWKLRKWGCAQGESRPRGRVSGDICTEQPAHSLVVMAQGCSGLPSPITCLIWSSIRWCNVLDRFPFGVLVLLIMSSENMPTKPWAHLLQTFPHVVICFYLCLW